LISISNKDGHTRDIQLKVLVRAAQTNENGKQQIKRMAKIYLEG